MGSVDHRKIAEKFERRAAKAKYPWERKRFLQIARRYRDLADQNELANKRDTGSERDKTTAGKEDQ